MRLIILLTLLSSCPLLWLGSHVRDLRAIHNGATRQFAMCVGNGSIYFFLADMSAPHPYWQVFFSSDLDYYHSYDERCFAGFGAKLFTAGDWGFLRIPFWFLTTLSSFVAWFLWRRWRRKQAQGFPMESNKPP